MTMLEQWKSLISDNEFELLINFLTNKKNIPELVDSMLIIIGSEVQTLKLLLDIQEETCPDDSQIESIGVLKFSDEGNSQSTYLELSKKKLLMIESGDKPIKKYAGTLKSIIHKQYSRKIINYDPNDDPDNFGNILFAFDIIITSNSKEKFIQDPGLKIRSRFIHLV